MSVLLALRCFLLLSQLLLQIENPLDGPGHHRQALLWRSAHRRCIVEAVVHVPHDLVLLHHHGDSLRLINPCVLLVVLRILLQR